MKIIEGGITAPKGFTSGGVHCGIKYRNKDLSLIYSKAPCLGCGLFTQNKVQAAPVKITRAHLKNNKAQAIIANSGNANCCTGEQGLKDARRICKVVADKLGISPSDVLVASTGIIGKRLPMERMEKAIPALLDRLSNERSLEAAHAIMTTDTKPKQISVELNLGSAKVRIGAIAKGAGMLQPHLATMLAFISTDAKIDKTRLQKALKEAVDNSFNLITVEGDTSTNDMVLMLANGLSGNKKLNAKEFMLFQQALNFVCLSLAKMLIKDAEGATKFAQIKVEQAKNITQAKQVAFKVANSALVKTALFGSNPNWGRIAAAAGCADSAIKADRLDIYLDGLKVLQKGVVSKVDRQRLNESFKKDEIEIKINLGLGKSATRVFTCDLSGKYVKINARY
ncbi:MAG: bifunctional glutamate N-acetyltransferase/amino-acid acetyltransferase ArgJ [Candidatus Omnitrophota bacterium]|nr:MAG: bifunctional glutamate N-acetyltransferase/amino-acid acetyltransferase ArgJ [Candidatus Omnitrophota bacterium]